MLIIYPNNRKTINGILIYLLFLLFNINNINHNFISILGGIGSLYSNPSLEYRQTPERG